VPNTATTIPAFLWKQYQGRLTFLGIGVKDIHLTGFQADVTPFTNFRIKYYWPVRGSQVRYKVYFFFSHNNPLLYFLP